MTTPWRAWVRGTASGALTHALSRSACTRWKILHQNLDPPRSECDTRWTSGAGKLGLMNSTLLLRQSSAQPSTICTHARRGAIPLSSGILSVEGSRPACLLAGLFFEFRTQTVAARCAFPLRIKRFPVIVHDSTCTNLCVLVFSAERCYAMYAYRSIEESC